MDTLNGEHDRILDVFEDIYRRMLENRQAHCIVNLPRSRPDGSGTVLTFGVQVIGREDFPAPDTKEVPDG